MKKQNNKEDFLNESLEGVLQKDLNEKPTAPTNSKFNKMESKSEEKIKELISNLEGKNLEMNQGLLSDEDIELIKGSLKEHFLFSNLSEEIM
jgi:LytS/YehU family sensor histidine kinase